MPVGGAEFEEVLTLLLRGEPVPERLRGHLAAAKAAKRNRHFFHWALEFPEVLVERGDSTRLSATHRGTRFPLM